MEFVNDAYWAVPLEEATQLMDDLQKERFTKFIKNRHIPGTDTGTLVVYKTDLEEFYEKFEYNYFDRVGYGR